MFGPTVPASRARIARSRFLSVLAVVGVSLIGLGAPLAAEEPPPTPEQRIERLERLLAQTRAELAELQKTPPSTEAGKIAEIQRQIEVLAREIEQMKLGEAGAPPAVTSASGVSGVSRGVGPAAARVYSGKTGVSIGGYGEALYQNFARRDEAGAPSGKDDQVTLLRAVLYVGYKFDERFVLNTELEYENAVVASDKGGEAEIEFAYLDYMHSRAFNVRAGLILIPVGLVNPLHEPTSFLGARRPDVEDAIIPSTWRELGFGVYGEAGPVTYSGYFVNGLNSAGYAAEEGIREGRQEGSEALARNWAFTGRLDYTGTPGLIAGASLFTGDSGQGRRTPSGAGFAARTTVWDLHADWRFRGLWLRGLYARSAVGDAGRVNEANGLEGSESVGSRQAGWYLQGAFDLLTLLPSTRGSLYPFVRYERYDTQARVPSGFERDPANDRREWTVGIGYKPIEQIIVKADWQRRRNAASTGVDQWNVSLGYIF